MSTYSEAYLSGKQFRLQMVVNQPPVVLSSSALGADVAPDRIWGGGAAHEDLSGPNEGPSAQGEDPMVQTRP